MKPDGGEQGNQKPNLLEQLVEKSRKPSIVMHSLEEQALRGGFSSVELDRREGQGPFWPRDSWLDFCERSRDAMSKSKTATKEELDAAFERIDQITSQKEAAGELVTDTR